ncbi:helix-turn-helix domain-containing protein [Bacillus sp. BH2]|uniref:helix-turn-helix domain-containing protein n=1 Tax=Bacillus sp. BH2 TaxID=2528958 RepID=UPI0010662667|nr:helix-turn-helix transcriptional regulator [Bacillus sp. BH2]TEA46005.1 helix-turn-helix domain-containing protein [Bacillus sp. BH2]
MIGEQIKSLRKKAKLTQQDLAEGIITRSYLSQIEQGSVQPTYEVLEKFAKKLNCTLDDILLKPIDKKMGTLELGRQLKLAENYVTTSQFEQAKKIIDKLERTIENMDVSNLEHGIFNWIRGKYCEYDKDYEKARLFYEASIQHLEGENNDIWLLKSLDRLGYTFIRLGNLQLALQTLRRAYKISIYEQIQDMNKISLLLSLSIVHGQMEEYHSAIHFLDEAIELNQLMNTFYMQGKIHMALGVCYMELKDYKKSESEFLNSLHFCKLSNEKADESGVHTNLGILYVRNSETKKGIKYLLQALDSSINLNLPSISISNIKLELAKAFFNAKQLEETEKYCNDVLYSEDRFVFMDQIYELLGDMCCHKQEYSKAINSYDEALSSYKKKNKTKKVNTVLKKIGDTYFYMNEPKLAVQNYQKIEFY